jgi:ribonuclease G
VYEILRQIRRERHNLQGYAVLVNAHPAVIDLMRDEEKAAVQEAEKRYMRRIEFNPRTEYHIEQFDLHGK